MLPLERYIFSRTAVNDIIGGKKKKNMDAKLFAVLHKMAKDRKDNVLAFVRHKNMDYHLQKTRRVSTYLV
jgi:uncharacterized protein YqeY